MSNYKEYSIIMVGKAASSMALLILDGKRESIARRYPERYLKNAADRLFQSKVDHDKIVDYTVFPCGTSGVFGALWDLGESLDTGLKINLADIPIDQAAIELCDFEDINPYESDSNGAYLIVAAEPGKVLEALRADGILGKVIGYTTKENARTIIGPTERYLTKP